VLDVPRHRLNRPQEAVAQRLDERQLLRQAVEKLRDRRLAIEQWCATRPTDDIVAALLELGIPVAPVKTIPQVVKDPHMWEREMMVKMADPVAGEIYAPGVTIKLSATPGRVGPVPTPGQHTDELLSEILNFDAAKLAALRQAKVIA